MGYSPLVYALISFVEASAKKGRIDYGELEKQTGFSQVYIRELFRKSTGRPLGNYVRVRKIWHSTFDLLHSDNTILEIALSYGFSSNESYTRAFQKVVGMTPSCFRQRRPLVGKKDMKLQSLADAGVRKEVCNFIRQAKESEEISLRLMKGIYCSM